MKDTLDIKLTDKWDGGSEEKLDKLVKALDLGYTTLQQLNFNLSFYQAKPICRVRKSIFKECVSPGDKMQVMLTM